MLALYLGTYTLFVVLLWGFFIIAKIHAYKFKPFSHNISKVTNFLLFFLIFISILGYILIFFSISGDGATINNYDSPNFKSIDY